MKCNKCSNANICLDHIEFPSLSGCTSGIPDRKVPTNADKIRSMSDEEMAEYLPCPHMVNWKKENYNACVHPNGKDGCKKCMLNWLQTKAEQESVMKNERFNQQK